MSNPSIFVTLLAQRLSAADASDVVFTNNNSMRETLLAAIATTEFDDVVGTYDIPAMLASYETLLNDKTYDDRQLRIFSNVADAFAQKINAGITSLRDVKQSVVELNDLIIDRLDSNMLRDPALAEAFNLSGEVPMEAIAWNKLSNINTRSIILKLHDSINRSVDDKITGSTIEILLEKIPHANYTNEIVLEKVALPKETITAIATTLHNAMSDVPSKTIAAALSNLLVLDAGKCRAAINILRNFGRGVDTTSVNRLLDLANVYSRMLPLLTDKVLDVSAKTRAEIIKHIGVIQQITDMTIYICTHYRTTVWRDAVLVKGPYYNPDTIADFEETGGNLTKLNQLYTATYTDSPVPVAGISAIFAARSSEQISTNIQKRTAVDRTKAETKKRDMLRNEFIFAATEWLNRNRANLSKGFMQTDYSLFAESVYDRDPTVPLTSKLYNMILTSCHLEKMTPVIYNRLSTAYTKQASATEQLSREQCDSIEAKVYADMISEYMVTHGILMV